MTPVTAIAILDRALARNGENVTLRRTVGVGNNTVNIDAPVRAFVRSYRLRDELIAGDLRVDDLLVTISPTGIAKAQWPGGQTHPSAGEEDDLPVKGDRIIAGGRVRRIDVVATFKVTGKIVRIEMRAVG